MSTEIVRKVFTNLLDPSLGKYFDPEYVQTVNGKVLDSQQFLHHLEVLRDHLTSVDVDMISIASNSDDVHTHHKVNAVKKDGSRSEYEVFAHILLKGDKMYRTWESVRQTSGCIDDKDLGDRH